MWPGIKCSTIGCYFETACKEVTSNPQITTTLFDGTYDQSDEQYTLTLSGHDLLVDGAEIGQSDSQCFLPIFPSSQLTEHWLIGNAFLDTTYAIFDMEPAYPLFAPNKNDYIQIALGELNTTNNALANTQSFEIMPDQIQFLTAFILSVVFGILLIIICLSYCTYMCLKRRSFFKEENEALAILRKLGEETEKENMEQQFNDNQNPMES